MEIIIEEYILYRRDSETEVSIYIEGDYSPGERAITSGPADNWHPGAPEEMEIVCCEIMIPLYGPFKNNYKYAHISIDLSESERDEIIEVLYKTLHEDSSDSMAEDAYYSKMEAREDYYDARDNTDY